MSSGYRSNRCVESAITLSVAVSCRRKQNCCLKMFAWYQTVMQILFIRSPIRYNIEKSFLLKKINWIFGTKDRFNSIIIILSVRFTKRDQNVWNFPKLNLLINSTINQWKAFEISSLETQKIAGMHKTLSNRLLNVKYLSETYRGVQNMTTLSTWPKKLYCL